MDRNSLYATIAIALLAFVAYYYQEAVSSYIRIILERGYLKVLLSIFVIAIVTVHSFRVKEIPSDRMVITTGFKQFDAIMTIMTYTAIVTTASSLLEGAFIQKFYDDAVYFTKFNSYDIGVLLAVSALLLWYVLFHVYILARELFFPKYRPVVSSNIGITSQSTRPPTAEAD